MKIKIILTAVFCIILSAIAISAQDKTTNFAGNWELDPAKSELSERMRIESMSMNVTQTDKNLTVETTTKRAERPESEKRGGGNGEGRMGRGGGGRMGGGMMGGGDMNFTYTLDGKETMADEVALKAKFEKGGKLKLIQTRSFETQMGVMSIKFVDIWELLDNGKTLKVKRNIETPRGVQSSEMIFAKK